MFDDIPFGKYYQPLSSPKHLQYINFNIPSTPVKSSDKQLKLPWLSPEQLSPDHNLNLLVNSVLSSPVSRSNTLQQALSENKAVVGLAESPFSQITVTPALEIPTRHYLSSNKGRRALLVQGKNETDLEFKRRRNRANQQRSRSNRRAVIERLQQEIVALNEIIAEKDKLIEHLQLTQFN
jgi:hypothetical protein